MTQRKKVVVAMSGGVDSTLCAKLLLEQGYEVYGASMNQYDGQDLSGAVAMARYLGIPYKIIDIRDTFRHIVLTEFIDAYAQGLTPNPCMICDEAVKFGLFYDTIRAAFDCPYFATGHYARILYDEEKSHYYVAKGLDLGKDQSYMMYPLSQDKLAHILFPLGRTFKKDTRLLSKEKGLPTYDMPESQDICFLTGDTTYTDYLKAHAPQIFRPGTITLQDGTILGEHQGLPYYTLGQRKGLGIAYRTPLYVIGLDAKTNRVIVGNNDDLFRKKLLASQLHFPSGRPTTQTFRAEGKIRYGIQAHLCTVHLEGDGRATVTFDSPQRAITPGQSVVWYEGDRLIGGGVITRPL